MKNEYHYDQDFLQGLRKLALACGPDSNQHDKAIVLINACIEAGINTGKLIVGTLVCVGFNPRHIGKLLKDFRGTDLSRHYWQRDQEGVYSVLE